MRKQPINSISEHVSLSTDMWLDLRDLATAEITSEDVDHPIESAHSRSWAGVASGETGETDYPSRL
jgi:hypothetical protein